MISIIIRSRNEERWIKFCLQAIFDQTYSDFEVILVDNNSTDNTVLKAKKFNIRKIVNIGKYRPGLAINEGIRVSSGDYIVCISAHCIPVNNKWLEQLVSNFKDPQIAGVYGRQEPMSFTSNSDKRDLLITFGLDRREQFKDSFFHNANSIFPRKIWKNFPFNEEVTNIEDRLWAEQVLKAGYKIVYDPKASVYHYHGIHHSGNPDRCANVVKILEKLENFHINAKNKIIDIEQLNIIAVIPIREENIYLAGKPLFEYTIQHALKSSYISKVIVSTDNENIAKHAEKIGAEVPFLRDKKHSRFDIILEQLMQYVLIDLETRRIFPDIMVMMEIQYPFRNLTLVDELISELIIQGLDTIIPAKKEYNSFWMENDSVYKRIDEGYIPRNLKKPVYKGIKGLGCVTHVSNVRYGQLFGNKVGIYEIDDLLSTIEIWSDKDLELAEIILSPKA